MESAKKQNAFLYLDKNGFYYFSEGLTSVISMAFAPTAVNHMDVISPTNLDNQINSFVEQYKLPPATITIVLSPNVTFEKDITGFAREAQNEEVNNFIDLIPFESVLTKTYPIDNGIKVIGFNDELYIELRKCFEKYSSNIESIVPYQMLGNDQALFKSLTVDNALQFVKRAAHFRQFSLLTQAPKENTPSPTPQPNTTQPSTAPAGTPKKINPRLIVMAGVFVVLFAILGYMIITMK